MRHLGFIAAALFLIACGPDPNARLPGVAAPAESGGTIGNGGVTGSGGSIATGNGGVTGSGGSIATGNGGNNSPFGVGGSSPLGSGGSTATGSGGNSPFGVGGSGSGGSIPVGTGGTGGGTGGSAGTGGTDAAGGVAGTGGDTGIDGGGGGDEPCVPAKTITASGSGNSGSFGTTGAFCFRTPDNISGWDCSNFTGRTLKVNGVTTACAAKSLPAKVNGYYYFDASAGGVDYASIYWF